MMGARGVLRTLQGGRVAFHCPGCNEFHQVRVEGDQRPGWTFDGNYERPTFSPSVLVTGSQTEHDATGKWTGEWKLGPDGKPLPSICHSFVRAGRIEFLSDCTHALAGQTAEMTLPED